MGVRRPAENPELALPAGKDAGVAEALAEANRGVAEWAGEAAAGAGGAEKRKACNRDMQDIQDKDKIIFQIKHKLRILIILYIPVNSGYWKGLVP